MDKARKPEPKKPYKPPKLTVYGTVRDLTRAVGRRRNPDGGTGSKSRTGQF
jgi:hypothetical protein